MNTGIVVSPAAIVAAYSAYLGELRDEILQVTRPMAPGLQRLCAGIETYWEACYARREARLQAMQAGRDAAVDEAILRISRPFSHLLYSELLHAGCTNAPVQAGYLFAAVRGIAQDEARDGRRSVASRARLLQSLRSRLG